MLRNIYLPRLIWLVGFIILLVLITISLVSGGPENTNTTQVFQSSITTLGLTDTSIPSYQVPSSDIEWSAGFSGVADIQAAFNHARGIENIQLVTTLPMMNLPAQGIWNSMTGGERALWLINKERLDRGINSLEGVETNINAVAEYYADYLYTNDAFSHTADGKQPWERIFANPVISTCHDPFAGENLAVLMMKGGTYIPLPVERSVYGWMYEDGDCCSWGHRNLILTEAYLENGGSPVAEGFLGIGRANGQDYSFMDEWDFAELIVMNVFDPCASWLYDPVKLFLPLTLK